MLCNWDMTPVHHTTNAAVRVHHGSDNQACYGYFLNVKISLRISLSTWQKGSCQSRHPPRCKQNLGEFCRIHGCLKWGRDLLSGREGRKWLRKNNPEADLVAASYWSSRPEKLGRRVGDEPDPVKPYWGQVQRGEEIQEMNPWSHHRANITQGTSNTEKLQAKCCLLLWNCDKLCILIKHAPPSK